ncbi:MAG: GNAT family N-acetyltransferase [Anaerolineales bacterium]|nr:GNAT family N-acetyltransferase [Anaerolineales bacterium]
MSQELVYTIRLKGALDARWSAVFAPLIMQPLQDETRLIGPVQDQSELFGILLKIRDMGLELISLFPGGNLLISPSSPFPVITTQRLLLREFTLSDVPVVFEYLRREDVNEWLETAPLQSMEQADARVRARMGLFHDRMGIRWAVALRSDPERVIGSCGFFSVRRGTQSVETGYDLHPDYWGKGMMTEALQAMLQFSFSEQELFPVHRIEALVAPGNIASIKLLEKFGFTREGLRREFFFWKGCYQDVLLYALLNGQEKR